LVVGNGEKVSLGGHVIFHNSSTSSSEIGCVRKILISDSCRRVQHVAVQRFTFGPALHPLLHLPVLELTDHDVVISPQVSFDISPIQSPYNARCILGHHLYRKSSARLH